MRVHRLRVTAFGPFAGTVEVDGDALGADGLFLLAGDTGSGKSSILDAICFALYGAVPGRRNEARALRSDLAAPGTAPEVELDVSLGSRRYRFRRSPAWERPKRRGTGTTTQQSSVTVQRLDDDAWTLLTSRLDEAGDLVGGLLGMTCTQFCQVVMLPQGEFETFLHARSDDRQRVLQQLFRTDRYARVEQWLAERRRVARRLADQRREEVVRVAHRVAEAAGGAVPDDLDDPDRAAAVDDLADWVELLADGALAEQTAAARESAAADAELATAEARLAADLATAGARARHTDATARRTALAAREPAVLDARERLDAARRSAAVAGLADVAEATAEARRRAQVRWLDLAPDGGTTDPGPLLVEARRRRDRLEQATGVRDELDALLHRATGLAARARAAREQGHRLAAEVSALPAEVDRLRDDLTATTALAATAPAALEARRRAEAGLAAARLVVDLEGQVADARLAEQEALAVKQDRHETWLEIREARLEGIAAELAVGLASGEDCPVCGSCTHPSPARPAPGAADRAGERRARQVLDTAEAELEVHRDRVRGLDGRLAAARVAAGGHSVEEWEQDAASARTAVEEATVASDRRQAVRAAADDAEARLERARAERDAVAGDAARTEAEEQALRAEASRAAARLREVLGEETDLAGALERVRRTETRLAEAVRAHDAHDRAAAEADRALADAEASARAHRFTDLAAARGARLDEHEATRLVAADEEHRRELHEVAALLADPDLRAAASAPAPDVDAARAAAAAARARAGAATRRAALAATRSTRLTALADELRDALAALAPAAAAADLAASVAGLASGRSPDNPAGLSLPAYVLSWRLSQVVAAANVRLGRMTDGRYVLEHAADGRARGGRRGGLDLAVRDEWSGRSRAPATLSGGETFVVSLALALGLADVVTQEASADAAGVDIETLFVDEGFGSLDADTLDDVLAVLDELREGGRVVGVVSHVAGMRERIGTRLEVLKSDQGSRVRLVHA